VAKAILIVGEDPARIDFNAPDAPPGVTAESIVSGLEGARDRLRRLGHTAEILWTGDTPGLITQVDKALAGPAFDIIVIGAGLRTLPLMASNFEILINQFHAKAQAARFAFNSNPADSDTAALRQCTPTQ
jgi:hypothetical protein